ncbi:radial spoke head 1 homolog [Aspergillus lentulus]|uniref:Radial spoke head 1 homolog n=1 Tax=Aspergillus lentulus TaxID=293939 RepID=A0AAN4PBY3_ASPLE|nr:radial spoke head 1 homolog [Aspergillus lentulus]
MAGAYATNLPWVTSGSPGKYTGAVFLKTVGTIVTKVPDGQGKIIYNSGDSYYEGQWQNGKRWYKGEYSCPEFTYNGEWRRDAPNGQGEIRWKTKGSYTGSFVNWKCEGSGIMTSVGGDTTNGTWKAGKLHGKFTRHALDGSYYTGTWDSTTNTGQGSGLRHSADGSVYEGYMKNKWVLHGRGKLTRPNGTIKTGTWRDGHFQHT